MTVEYVSRVLLATRWTGDNSAAVLATVHTVSGYTGNQWEILVETPEILVLRETGPTGLTAEWPVRLGQWVIVAPDFGIVARMPDDAFQARYRPIVKIIDDAVDKLKADKDFIDAVAAKVKEKP